MEQNVLDVQIVCDNLAEAYDLLEKLDESAPRRAWILEEYRSSWGMERTVYRKPTCYIQIWLDADEVGLLKENGWTVWISEE